MSRPGSEASTLRRAALSVHALDAADREWILSSLPPAERDRLGGLLQELRELGIPAEAVPEAAWSDPPPEGMARLWNLQDGDVVQLARLLRAEPPMIAAALLAARPWPWRERLLALLDVPAAVAAAQGCGEDPPPAALHASVVRAVLQRMQPPPTRAASATRAASWRALFTRLRARSSW